MKDIIVKIPAKNPKSLPYPTYRIVVIILALLGLADSIYLAIQHYQVHTDMAHKSFCAISKSINCDTVSQSVYSIFFGVPFAVWGIVAYVFMLVLSIAFMKDSSRKSTRIWTCAFLACIVFVCYSIVLAFVSSYLIKSYCIMCIASYFVNLVLLYFCWITVRRFTKIGLINEVWQFFRYLIFFKKPLFPILIVFAIIAFSLMAFYPPYWRVEVPLFNADVATGLTERNSPWIGAENPVLVIEEFSDYQCFQCRKMHFFLRQMVNQYPDKLRLVHNHFPMDDTINPLVDEPFHQGGLLLSLAVELAQEDGRFWEVNDIIFELVSEKPAFDLEELAAATGISTERILEAVKDRGMLSLIYIDILRGLNYGVEGTPSYLINGKLYQAQIPAEIIRMLEE